MFSIYQDEKEERNIYSEHGEKIYYYVTPPPLSKGAWRY